MKISLQFTASDRRGVDLLKFIHKVRRHRLAGMYKACYQDEACRDSEGQNFIQSSKLRCCGKG